MLWLAFELSASPVRYSEVQIRAGELAETG